jgi:hypothetical protein
MFLVATMKARTITGASVICYVNGKVLGRATGFSFQSVTPRRAIYGIDSCEPYELAPTQAKVSGTISVVRTIGDGGADGMVADFEDLSRERYFSIALVERGSDRVFFQASACSLVSQLWSIPSKSHISGTLSFEALGWSNETTP